MSRREMLDAAHAAHAQWVEQHADDVPAVPEHSRPHTRGGGSDYAEHHADRSAPAEVDDVLSAQLAALLPGAR